MLNLTRVYCGVEQPQDGLRYGHGHRAVASASTRKPIVVWNITRRCNLKCIHCYADSEAREYPGELSYQECLTVLDDLAAFGVPAVLFSGGEPTIHPHFLDLVKEAKIRKLRVTISTNATLIDRKLAEALKEQDVSYVGISLDGIGATHDAFRGKKGAFEKTVQAFHHCAAAGVKSGLRLTLSRNTVNDLDNILDFIAKEDVKRVCFYHLVYSGRGSATQELTSEKAKGALDRILARTAQWVREGTPREVLTVDQPADAAYLLLKMRNENHPLLPKALELLRWNGGGAHSSGTGIGNIDSQGHVHPDQFWQTHDLGSVREKPFSKIWTESKDELLLGLRNRLPLLQGRCATCGWQKICGGGFRVRALQKFGNPWMEDPGCYLSQEEISSGLDGLLKELAVA